MLDSIYAHREQDGHRVWLRIVKVQSALTEAELQLLLAELGVGVVLDGR